MSTQSLVPELSVVDGKVVATSLHVADVFDKLHKNVLRDIEEILAQVDDSFGKLNFEPSEYTHTNNLGFSVNKPMVLLTRDGFTLLAMGFTGKRALEFKIAYINAYNAME
ncbi:MAG: Rha family transcriptional regulator [Candidatus Competibacter denitrificans]